MSETKTCSKCGETKTLDLFVARKAVKSGYGAQCKKCDRMRNRELEAARKLRPVEPADSIYRVRIPTERVLALVDAWQEKYPDIRLHEVFPATARRVWAMRHEQATVGFDYVDRLLIQLGIEDAWHHELADIYESYQLVLEEAV